MNVVGARESREFAAQACSTLGPRVQAEESHCRGRPPARHLTKRLKKGVN